MAPKRRWTGTVGIPAQDTSRFTPFMSAVAGLTMPAGWKFLVTQNFDCAHSCNNMASKFDGERLLLMGDDHSFNSDFLLRLLDHDLDIVAGLCLSRRPPFMPVARVDGAPLVLEGEPRLLEVDETGTAGMLIKREVFEALEFPYFSNVYREDGSLLSDDLYFCRKARAAGFKIHVDTSVLLGHIALVGIRPEYDAGKWHRALDVGDFTLRIS
jgi:hypothetical protein